jgi:hypothetical protein
MTLLSGSIALLMMLGAAGCSTSSNACTQGTSITCTGPSGCSGSQLCNSAGSGSGTCTCQADAGRNEAGADGEGPNDATADTNTADQSVSDASDDGAPHVKRAFVCSRFVDGDLATLGGGSGSDPGAAGADALCNQDATKHKLGGAWNAWISTSKVAAKDHLAGGGPWYLVNGKTLVANSISDLTTKGPANAINMLADGTVDALGTQVRTGTKANGTLSSSLTSCNDWTSSSAGLTALGGSDLLSTGGWTADTVTLCSIGTTTLYCFEQ